MVCGEGSDHLGYELPADRPTAEPRAVVDQRTVDAVGEATEDRFAVAGHGQRTAPRVVERHVRQAGETTLEGHPVGPGGPTPEAATGHGVTAVAVDVADQDPAVDQASHRGAGRCRRNHTPGQVATY